MCSSMMVNRLRPSPYLGATRKCASREVTVFKNVTQFSETATRHNNTGCIFGYATHHSEERSRNVKLNLGMPTFFVARTALRGGSLLQDLPSVSLRIMDWTVSTELHS